MSNVKAFKDLGIVATSDAFTGDKIKIGRILDRDIVVHKYRIVPSSSKIRVPASGWTCR